MFRLGEKILLWALCAFFVCLRVLHAQPVTYTIEDGLPNRDVTSTIEDHEGFLWVATANGLARFDGNEFILLENVGKDSANLLNPNITALAKTPKGQLCIGTLKGLALLSPDRTKLWYPIPDTSPIARKQILSIAVFDDQHIAFATFYGLYILSKGKVQTVATFSPKIDGPNRTTLHTIDSNRILAFHIKSLGAGTDFFVVNRSGEALQRNTVNASCLGATLGLDNRVYTAFVLSGPNQANKIAIEAYSLEGEPLGHWQMEPSFPLPIVDQFSIFSRSGHLWITRSGTPLIQFDHEKGDFSLSVGEEIVKKIPPVTSNFSNIHSDTHENLWVSTNGGLIGLSLKQDRFHVLKPGHLPKDEVYSTRLIYALDEKHLFISKWGNSFLMNVEDQEFTPYNPLKSDGTPLNIRCILPFGSDSLLVGTEWTSLFWLKPGSTALEPALIDSSNQIYRSVMSLVRDKEGKVWGGGIGGLFWFDPKEKIIHELKNQGFEIGQGGVYELSYDPERNLIWAASDKGLVKFEIESGQFKIYDLRLGSDVMSSSKSTCLILKEDLLWVGTWGNGLVRFDRSTEEITHFTTQNGLCHNLIYSMLEDDRGRIWLGTANGLSAFDPSSEDFTSYFKEDGIAHNEFNTGSVYKDPEGTLYMGGINGISSFKPDQVLGEKEHSEIRLTQIIQHNGKTNTEQKTTFDIQQLKALTINPHDRYFTVFFSHKDLLYPSKTYEYQLKGLTDNWSFLGSSKKIRFAGLPAGNYTLSIRSTDDTKGENILSLPITVLAPWYERWWAITLFTLSGLALIFLFFSLRFRQLKTVNQLKLERLRVEKQEELDQLKSDFFANISHEFRTPLTLILGPLEKRLSGQAPERDKRDFGMMRRNANRLLSLINQLLDLSKLDSGKMSFRPVLKDLAAHLRLLCSNFENQAALRNIDFHLTLEEEELLTAYDVDQMEKIMNNLLSNAFKFCGEGGRVEVVCRQPDAQSIRISVANTGEEIPAHILPDLFKRFYRQEQDMAQGTGIGLALTKEFVELHQGIIKASSEGGLTTFTIDLPVHVQEGADTSETRSFAGPSSPLTTYTETASPREGDDQQKKEDLPLVLVVDDNADLRAFLSDILTPHYQVLQAKNGLEGWDQARERIPDLVVSDLMMPGMDGKQLCHKLKTDALTSHIPVILLTAKATQESKLEGLEKGADDYLMKPFSGPELLIRVKNLIRLRQLLREKYSGQKLVEIGQKQPADLEDEFMQKVIKVMEAQAHEEDFTVNVLYEKLFLSPRQVQRKLKALTNQTPSNFIRKYRLQKAYEKILRKEGTISEIATSVGISNLTYFGRSFKQEFGVSPSEL